MHRKKNPEIPIILPIMFVSTLDGLNTFYRFNGVSKLSFFLHCLQIIHLLFQVLLLINEQLPAKKRKLPTKILCMQDTFFFVFTTHLL